MAEYAVMESVQKLPAPTDIARLALALIKSDRQILFVLYPILVLPHLISVTSTMSTPSAPLGLKLIQFILEIIFLLIICERALNTVHFSNMGLSLYHRLRFCFAQIVYWSSLTIPLYLIRVVPDSSKVLILAFLVPMMFLAVRYYFLFFTLIISPTAGIVQAVKESRLLLVADSRLPFKALIPALGVSMFIVGLAHGLSPDLREVWVAYLVAGCSGIFWLLNCYLSLSAALLFTPERLWQAPDTAKRVAQQITLLCHSTADTWASMLKPSMGRILILLGVAIWFANVMRYAHLMPVAAIKLTKLDVQENLLRVDLDVSDEKFNFRGFSPVSFRLASERGTFIAPYPSAVYINGERRELFDSFPAISTHALLTLEFENEDPARGFNALEDMHLWYNMVKLASLASPKK